MRVLQEARPSCLSCVRKHLAQAEVLMGEARQGYPEHRWRAIGHLGEAGDECCQGYPELAAEIRRHRIKYMADPSYVVPCMKLIEKASALVTESDLTDAMSSGAVRVSVKCPSCGQVGKWHKTGSGYHCAECKAALSESADDFYAGMAGGEWKKAAQKDDKKRAQLQLKRRSLKTLYRKGAK